MDIQSSFPIKRNPIYITCTAQSNMGENNDFIFDPVIVFTWTYLSKSIIASVKLVDHMLDFKWCTI